MMVDCVVVPSVKAQKDPIAHVPANPSIYPNVLFGAEEYTMDVTVVTQQEPSKGRSV